MQVLLHRLQPLYTLLNTENELVIGFKTYFSFFLKWLDSIFFKGEKESGIGEKLKCSFLVSRQQQNFFELIVRILNIWAFFVFAKKQGLEKNRISYEMKVLDLLETDLYPLV